MFSRGFDSDPDQLNPDPSVNHVYLGAVLSSLARVGSMVATQNHGRSSKQIQIGYIMMNTV